jgi:hypothetical protein
MIVGVDDDDTLAVKEAIVLLRCLSFSGGLIEKYEAALFGSATDLLVTDEDARQGGRLAIEAPGGDVNVGALACEDVIGGVDDGQESGLAP